MGRFSELELWRDVLCDNTWRKARVSEARGGREPSICTFALVGEQLSCRTHNAALCSYDGPARTSGMKRDQTTGYGSAQTVRRSSGPRSNTSAKRSAVWDSAARLPVQRFQPRCVNPMWSS